MTPEIDINEAILQGCIQAITEISKEKYINIGIIKEQVEAARLSEKAAISELRVFKLTSMLHKEKLEEEIDNLKDRILELQEFLANDPIQETTD